MPREDKKVSPRLEVYLKHSILVALDGTEEEFKEGNPSSSARQRLDTIRKTLADGFLDKIVEECSRPGFAVSPLGREATSLLTELVDSVTSEVGRAIVGLVVLQLTIKAICPEQSIRLHKGGGRGECFSWKDGIPMRVLDKNFITPVLRKYGLLRINADGVFMTRSLAENYPYSKLYKAALRGARTAWLEIVDLIEAHALPPLDGLKHMIAMLINRSERFRLLGAEALESVNKAVKRVSTLSDGISFIKTFVDSSTYSARLFEIAMHSLFQVLEDCHSLAGYLKPLSQMRSANKKHGNIGDIEVTSGQGNMLILESWDAKYGKPYLRDELEELGEKLSSHPEIEIAGFVVDSKPNLKDEIISRITELEALYNVRIMILEFEAWARMQLENAKIDKEAVSSLWIIAFAESLCQMRRERAPIDEPSDAWVEDLRLYSAKWYKS